MAFPTLTKADFIGSIRLSVDNETEADLNDFIAEKYPFHARALLGAEVFDLITGITLDNFPKWKDLVNGITYDNIRADKKLFQIGINAIIKRLIFFDFVRDYNFNTPVGFIRNNNENSNNTSGEGVNAIAGTNYNQAIDEYNCQVIPFLENYEDFEGEITSIVDLTVTFRINTPLTFYLLDGDTVTIAGTDYVISGLVLNTSFVITETALDLTLTEYTYSPFEQVCETIQESIVF